MFLNQCLDEKESQVMFNSVFESYNGYELSLESRKLLSKQKDASLTYGEVSYEGLHAILRIIDPKEGFEFLDLGSGLGKALFLVSVLYPCKRLIGVEMLPLLFSASKDILDGFFNEMQQRFEGVSLPEVSLVNDTFMNTVSVSNSDIIFACATSFNDSQFHFIKESVNSMKEGSHLIVFTRPIYHDFLECVHKGVYQMGWGSPTVYIYRKVISTR